ncbi:hypothetical protein ACOSQ3_029791 [Xanthoceras sorbifolium]
MAEFLVVAEAEEDDDPGGSGGEPRKRSYGGGAGKTVAPSGEGSGEGETISRGQVRRRPAIWKRSGTRSNLYQRSGMRSDMYQIGSVNEIGKRDRRKKNWNLDYHSSDTMIMKLGIILHSLIVHYNWKPIYK